MKTVMEVKNEEKKESKLKECFVLWKQTAKSGLEYLTGYEILENGKKGVNLKAFYNTTKKNPEEPDIRVSCTDKEGKITGEVASLWDTIAKNEKRYLTGRTNEKERLVAWYNESGNEKQPYIRCYYK